MPPRKGKNKLTTAKASTSAPKNKPKNKQKEEILIDLSDNPCPTTSESDTDASEGQERSSTTRRPPQDVPRKKSRTSNDNTMEEDFALPLPTINIPVNTPKTATHSDTNAQQSKDDHSGAAHKAQNGNQTLNNDPNQTNLPVTSDTQNKEQPRDPHVSHHTNKDDTIMDDAQQSAAIIADSSYFKAAAPIIDLIKDKESKKQCLGRIADYCIDRYESFYRVTRIGNNKESLIVVLVKDETDFTNLTNSTHEDLVVNTESDIPQFFKYDPKAILAERNLRTVVVRDIPAFLNQEILSTRFKKYGLIEKIKLHTPHNSIYQMAEITYTDPDIVERIGRAHWSIFLKGECIRLYPATMTPEQRSTKQQFSAILRGLPTGIRAIDLVPIFREVNAVSIGFARHIKSYDTKPWAYFSFSSEEAKQAAMEISCSFNGKLLRWIETSQAKHLCVRCSSMEHITKDCDALKSRGRNPTPKSIQNLYDKFHLKNTTIKKPKPSNKEDRYKEDNETDKDSISESRSRSRSRSRSSSSRTRSLSKRRNQENASEED